MRTRLSSTALLLALAAATLTGCAAAGQLQDSGAAPTVTELSPSPLWPAAATAPAAPSATPSDQPTPSPLPGITAAGDRIEDVPVTAVLQKDPGLRPEERLALAGCARCEVRPAQYRDLTGDGRTELITAVLVLDRAFLHVYTLRDRQVVPILDLQALPGFTADTVGTDLAVHEQTNQATEIITTYHWNGVRMAVEGRKTIVTGAGVDLPLGADPTGSESALPSAAPSVRRSGLPWPSLPGVPRPVVPSARPTPAPAVTP